MRLLKPLLLVLLLLLMIGLVLVWTLPAQRAWDWISPQLPQLRLERLAGSVWRGDAGRAQFSGLALGRLGWQLSPRALLAGRLDARLRMEGGAVRGQGRVLAWRDGRLRAEDVLLAMPAELLGPLLDLPAFEPLGEIDLRADWIELAPGTTPQASGQLVWRNAVLTGMTAVSLGELRVEFTPAADGALIASIRNQGGAIAVDGSYRLLGEAFEVEALLRPRSEDPVIAEALLFMGEPLGDGTTLLRITGTLTAPAEA